MVSWGCRFPPKNEQKQVLKITSVIWMVTWNCQTILYEVTQWSKNLLFPLIQCFALIRLMELECWRLFQIHSRNCRKISVIEMNFNHSSLQILVRINSHVTFTNQRYLQLQIPQLIFKWMHVINWFFFFVFFKSFSQHFDVIQGLLYLVNIESQWHLKIPWGWNVA